MALEIERKFLLDSDAWRSEVSDSLHLVQGYLFSRPLPPVEAPEFARRRFLNGPTDFPRTNPQKKVTG